MDGQLPKYKQKFLDQMNTMREEQFMRNNAEDDSNYTLQKKIEYIPQQNNIINISQYSSSDWKQQLNKTSYRQYHDLSHHQLNLLINPEIAKKKNNIQSTPISEYSNAMHNKTVFVNPKNTSC